MVRARRTSAGGIVYHVLNRSNGRLRIFVKAEDFAAFERAGGGAGAVRYAAVRLLPDGQSLASGAVAREDGDLSQFMQWVTMTHVQRWHAHGTAGSGTCTRGGSRVFPCNRTRTTLPCCGMWSRIRCGRACAAERGLGVEQSCDS